MGLLRELMSCQIFPLTMGRSRRGMSVGGEVVQFCCPIVCTLWHRLLSRFRDYRELLAGENTLGVNRVEAMLRPRDDVLCLVNVVGRSVSDTATTEFRSDI